MAPDMTYNVFIFIRSVLCNIVCNNCAQCNAHTYEQT